jgi:3-deoxy-D-manno-octulosonic-acid transferase
MTIYSALLAAVLVVGAPYWLVRMMTSGRYRAGLAGRLGRVPGELRAAVREKHVIWLHAVSVGEVMAAARLVEELKVALPGWVVAVSTTTETGQTLARQRIKGSPVFYLPLDFAVVVRRYLGVLQPKILVLMESELWPRLILECSKVGIPVAVVNARISDRSLPRYLRLRKIWRPLLAKVSLFLAQSTESAKRLVLIGVPEVRVRTSGNLKYDVRAAAGNAMTGRIGALLGGARLVVAGSTLADEETAVLAAWSSMLEAAPDAVMLIAPRHTDRFNEVAGLVEKSAHPFVRCSRLLTGAITVAPFTGGTVLLLDTIGDLAAVYSLASAAFVGGSLVPMGGHNPLEAAQFGVPVAMGASYENFREMVEMMRSEDAIRVTTREGLAGMLVTLLGDEGKAVGARGLAVFEAQAGATGRTVEALLELLPGRGQ